MPTRTERLALVQQRLPAAAYAKRLLLARELADAFAEIQRRCADGETARAACRAVLPERRYGSVMRLLRQWQAEGLDALIDCRLPPKQVALPANIDVLIEAVARALPRAGSPEIVAHLLAHHGVRVSEAKVRARLRAVGLARPPGPPPSRRPPATGGREVAQTEPTTTVPCGAAGAALLTALDGKAGGTRDLAEAIVACAQALPEPEAPVEDDRADRDEKGRFLPTYNRARARRFAKVGSRFESVRSRWRHKDPATLRCASADVKWTRLKLLTLLLTPLVIERARLPELQYGLDDRLGQLVGRPYRPSTLDKHLREWKLIGAAEAMGSAFLHHLLRTAPEPRDAATGVVVLYGDGTVNPYWTAGHARSAKVSRRGRAMPAVTTVTLNNGLGTPVRFAAVPGHIYLPDIMPRLLDEYEAAAGPDTLRRVVVLDRESHAVAFFKQLGQRYTFIIALRSNVTGPSAAFRDVGLWAGFQGGAEVCDAFLTLRDRRAGQADLEVRAVGFRRRPDGPVLWLATNGERELLTAADIARLYLGRWPNQERVYRDAQGRVGLGRLHGYGKEEIEHVAVVTRLEVVDATLDRLAPELARLRDSVDELTPEYQAAKQAAEEAGRAEIRALKALERASPEAESAIAASWRTLRAAAAAATKVFAERAKTHAVVTSRAERLERKEGALLAERETLARNTMILTVDTELDEIMLAIKCLFIHLSQRLLREYLGMKLELDSLIRRVLTLPGELDVDKRGRAVAIRIYRNPKDPEATAAVEQAIARLGHQSNGVPLAIMDPPGRWIR